MRLTTENKIKRYPVGYEMPRTEKNVYGVIFCYMNVGSAYVWRSENAPIPIEVGKRGNGATFYAKVNGVILEHQYPSMREAAIAGVKISGQYALTTVQPLNWP